MSTIVIKSRQQIATDAARAAGIRLYWRSSYPRWHWDTGEIARSSGTKYFSIAAILRDCDYTDERIEAAYEAARLVEDMDQAEAIIQTAYDHVGRMPLGGTS